MMTGQTGVRGSREHQRPKADTGTDLHAHPARKPGDTGSYTVCHRYWKLPAGSYKASADDA